MILSIRPIRYDGKDRQKCEQRMNVTGSCDGKAEYLIASRRNEHDAEIALCNYHARKTVGDMMSLMNGVPR